VWISLAACIGLVTAGCGRATDSCDRAIERLDRIHALTAKQKTDALEECRQGKYAAYDPVLRCALDAETDAAAASCIERFQKAVLKPGAAEGAGKNPLLDEHR